MTALPSTPEMYDLRMSEAARPLFEAVKAFIADEVEPHTHEFFHLGENRAERWGYGEGQLELLDDLKACLLYTSPSPRDRQKSRMPSSA